MSFDLSSSLFHWLHRASQAANDSFARGIGLPDGLTLRQLVVLAAIADNEGASQTTLVELTGVDRSTLADMVRRLLKKGLVARRRTKEDARAYAVKLTTEGVRTLSGARDVATDSERAFTASLSASDRAHLLRMLKTLASAR